MLVSLGRLILILCLIAQGTAIAQNRVIDSLKAVIAQQANDSNTIKAYIALSAEQLNFSYDSSVYNAEMAIELAKKQGDKRREADAFMRMGTAHNFKGEYELATSSYETALALFKEQALYLNMGKALNNLGFMYRNMADYPKSLDYFMQSLKIKEEHGTAADVGVAYQNIGIVFAIQNEIETAAEYIQKAVELFYKSGDSVKYYSVLIDLSSL
jgi:tetratricopeptide (TPR) repeat protein